eukprot:TRINITY_DN19309_c0_g1_i1.p1 TRINITY_DN19309_c0_g1~~TRINITY_DN19309_c0_g1_i1.p1  ORF type:complete len:183 (-),score=26.09 TRINITY_DN19309_c0_g1_i1:152-700(-)
MGSCLSTPNAIKEDFVLPPSIQSQQSTNREQLMDIVKHPQLSILFHKYLKTIFSNEILSFFMDVEEFRDIEELSARKAKAHQVISKYFSRDSDTEISISSEDLEKIKANVATCPTEMFNKVQQHVFLTLVDDCLPNFFQWELYTSFVSDPLTRRVFLCGVRRTQSVNQLIRYSDKQSLAIAT